MRTLWFKAKTYGWGWYPSSWQGWLTLVVYLILIYLDFKRTGGASNYVTDTVFLTLVLIAICYKTGEKPEWRWGNKK